MTKRKPVLRNCRPLSEAAQALLLRELAEADAELVRADCVYQEAKVIYDVAVMKRNATQEAIDRLTALHAFKEEPAAYG